MTDLNYSKIIRHDAPGELRAALLDQDGRPCRLFLERWDGLGAPAPLGSGHTARLKAFADAIGGAFLELESGEEVFLRLKTRDGVTEGARLTVKIASEARQGKLARAVRMDTDTDEIIAWALWRSQISGVDGLPEDQDREGVAAAFEEALLPSVTLLGGGQLHIDRTRALTAFDLDTSGRIQNGSAGARALAINKDGVNEMARQISLRGLGGNLVLDCVEPLNKAAGETIRATAQQAFERFDLAGLKVLRPSSLGMMEATMPWRTTPIEDRLSADPGETELLDLFREAARAAAANPAGLFQLELSNSARQAYLDRRTVANAALTQHFGGRVAISATEAKTSKVQKR